MTELHVPVGRTFAGDAVGAVFLEALLRFGGGEPLRRRSELGQQVARAGAACVSQPLANLVAHLPLANDSRGCFSLIIPIHRLEDRKSAESLEHRVVTPNYAALFHLRAELPSNNPKVSSPVATPLAGSTRATAAIRPVGR